MYICIYMLSQSIRGIGCVTCNKVSFLNQSNQVGSPTTLGALMVGIDWQSILQARVQNMMRTDAEKAMEKSVVGEFDDAILKRVQVHQEAIKELRADATAGNTHAAAIAFHEKRISYYMS